LQLGRTHDALTAYREALDFAVDPPDQGNAWFGIASALRIMDRHEEALDALGHAETALAATADAQTRARLYTLRGNLSFPLGHFDACLRAHEQARVFASQANSPIDIARALGGLGDAYYQRGKMLTARDHFVQCATQARTHGMVSVLLANLPMVGITNIYCGAIEAANESLEEAFELSRRIGDLRSELLVHLCLSTGLMMQARLDECVTRARRALELAIQLGARRFQAETLGVLANALYSQGEQLGALRLAEEGLQLGRETGMSYCGPALLSVLARVTGNDEQRAQALSEAEALLANGCVSHSYFEFYSNAIEVSLVKQRWDEARRYAQALEMYTSEEPLPWTQLLIRRGIALADVGEGRPCVETLMQLREECLRMKTLHLLGGIEEGMAIGCRL
jgi:tetratricopeptide (TPR) repeat protein